MEATSRSQTNVKILLTKDNLLIVNAALNEICNGIEIFEFETRIGASRNKVADLQEIILSLIDSCDLAGDI